MGFALVGALRDDDANLMEPKGSRLLPQRSTTPLVYSVSTLDRVCCCRKKELKVRSPVKRKRESFVQLLELYSYLHDSEGGVEIPREFPA